MMIVILLLTIFSGYWTKIKLILKCTMMNFLVVFVGHLLPVPYFKAHVSLFQDVLTFFF